MKSAHGRLSENRKPTAENLFRLIFSLIFVKYVQYSPQMIEKLGRFPTRLGTILYAIQASRARITQKFLILSEGFEKLIDTTVRPP